MNTIIRSLQTGEANELVQLRRPGDIGGHSVIYNEMLRVGQGEGYAI